MTTDDSSRRPSLRGTIERRVLINYRVDPEVVQPLLSRGFVPDVYDGHAIVGICLIQLRVRPSGVPKRIGFRSMNGAHRFAVIDPSGRPAVYIPRRDTNSTIVSLAGGRVFPGAHQRASIEVTGDDDHFAIRLASLDDEIRVTVAARVTDALPTTSVFGGMVSASTFFERADIGYSERRDGTKLDCLQLRATNWSMTPLAVDQVESSYFDNPAFIATRSFDSALLMRDIDHAWHRLPSIDR